MRSKTIPRQIYEKPLDATLTNRVSIYASGAKSRRRMHRRGTKERDKLGGKKKDMKHTENRGERGIKKEK